MTEQQIQKKRIDQLEAEGYYVIKLVKTNKNGIPDVVAIAPNADVLFSEIKTETGRLSRLQEYRLKELNGYGFRTEVYRGNKLSDRDRGSDAAPGADRGPGTDLF